MSKTTTGPRSSSTSSSFLGTLFTLLRRLSILVVLSLLLSHFIVGDFTWGYKGKWIHRKTYFPPRQHLYSERELAEHDGTIPGKPILIAIDGDVFDVSANRRVYGPGGMYFAAAGKDAARAFITGCFDEHDTHDLRGIPDEQLAAIDRWKAFFTNHKDYWRAGKVLHAPIDPASPIPPPCKSGKGVPGQGKPGARPAEARQPGGAATAANARREL